MKLIVSICREIYNLYYKTLKVFRGELIGLSEQAVGFVELSYRITSGHF
jgi:hypothetical protein